MPKRPNIVPNLRVDIPDYKQNGYVFTEESLKHFVDRALHANYSRVLEGFRVEIANQTSNPGLFTIYSGLAFDRSGQIVDNENDLNAQRSYTLAANGTYYVEVEFTTAESDTDARALWDPLYDNGADPSGDIRPDGREFDQNIATRLSPDWTIVTPISTSGFTATSDYDSVRIPIAVITRSGGVITGGSTVNAKTLLENNVSISATAIKMTNSRIFPDSFTGTLGAESITVTDNDRENGILTVAPALTSSHTRGERLTQTGSNIPVFLAERPYPTASGLTSEDYRLRFWQGDEERGYVYGQDAYTATGRSDLELKSLKDYVDFLSSQILELKTGAARASDFGSIAPPTSFNNSLRYFDRSPGILNSRTATITIGDGTSSWGDYNVSSMGSFKAAFDAAYSALPNSGGRIHVKGSNSTYNVTTSITLNSATKKVIVSGDGQYSTLIEAQSSNAAFVIESEVYFEHLAVLRDSSATISRALELSTSAVVDIYNCRIDGMSCVDLVNNCNFRNVDFTSSVVAGSDVIFLAMTNSTFRDCSFANSVNNASSYAVQTDTSTSNVLFEDCTFSVTGTANYVVALNSSSLSDIKFINCQFSGGDGDTVAVLLGTVTDFIFKDCNSSCSGGFIIGNDDPSGIVVSGGNFDYAADKRCLEFSGAGAGAKFVVEGCTITQATGGTSGTGIFADYAFDSIIRDVKFVKCNRGLVVLELEEMLVSNCMFDGQSNMSVGISASESSGCSITNMIIKGCVFTAIKLAGTSAAGITMGDASSGSISELVIDSCIFDDIGIASNTNAYGVWLKIDEAVENCVISNNIFEEIEQGATNEGAIYAFGIDGGSISGNTMRNVIRGIRIPDEFQELVISGNSINSSGTGAISITTNTNSANLTISGNSLTATGTILNVTVGTGTLTAVAVNGNTVTGGTTGISVATLANYVTIAGNTLYSTNTNYIGIYAELFYGLVSSNFIRSTGSGVVNGISTGTSSDELIINSNNIILGSGAAIGIQATNASAALINGNNVVVSSTNNAVEASSTEGFVFGNIVHNPGAGGAIDLNGASIDGVSGNLHNQTS